MREGPDGGGPRPGGSDPDPFHLPTLSGGEVEARLEGGGGPLLVDFFATWCGPCAWIVPTLKALREEVGEEVEIVKVDVDEATELAGALRITSVPTVILFEEGTEVERSRGVEPERVRAMAEGAAQRVRDRHALPDARPLVAGDTARDDGEDAPPDLSGKGSSEPRVGGSGTPRSGAASG